MLKQLRHFLSELRRRNVYRVAGTYLVAAFVVLQVADMAAGAFSLPGWFEPMIWVVCGLGLPIALVLAWALELTPEGVRATPETQDDQTESDSSANQLGVVLWIGTIVIAVGLGGAWWLTGESSFNWGTRLGADPGAERSVAVLPFEVTGGASEDWRDAMVTMLSTGLDGVGGIRAIPDRRVFAALDAVDTSRVDDGQDVGLVAAREAEADFAVGGSAVSLGEKLRLVANVYRTETGERVDQTQVQGDPEQIVELANELTRNLLTVLLERSGADLPTVNLADLTTHSPPALKSYLAGERRYRAGDYRAATEEYRAAIKADSNFALAHLRLASTLGWTGEAGYNWAEPLREAYELADRLPLRHRRHVWTEYTWALAGRYEAAADCLKTLTEIYPSDPGFWYEYGEVLFHAAVPRGWPEAETAFEQAVELDPDVAPYRYHLMDLALSVHDDSSLAASRIRAYPDSPLKRLYQAVWDVNYGAPADREEAWKRLDTLTAPVPLQYWVPWQLSHPTDLDLQARLIRRLRDRVDTDREAFTDQLTFNLLDRGHVQEAVALLEQQFDPAAQRCLLARALSLGYSIPDSLLLPVDPSESTGEEAPGACGLYRITRGDTNSLEDVYDRLRSQNDTLTVRSLRGYRAFRSNDLQKARRLWSGFNEQGTTGAIWRGDLYRRLGDLERAEGWYYAAWEHPIAHQRLGQLYERMNRPDAAVAGYQWFIDAWKQADPALQPQVEQARERIRSLTDEPGRLSAAPREAVGVAQGPRKGGGDGRLSAGFSFPESPRRSTDPAEVPDDDQIERELILSRQVRTRP